MPAATATQPQHLINSQFIAQGVNLLEFDPNDPAGTKGYGRELVFDLVFDTVEPNGQYTIPQGTYYQPDPSSLFQSVSSVIKSAAAFSASFTQSRSVSVAASGSPFGFPASLFSASFSRSAGYNNHQEASRKYAGVSSESRAYVTCWILRNDAMPLSAAFRDAVAQLPPSYDQTRYDAFIERFGTHVSAVITFGGRGWQNYRMTSTQYDSLHTAGTNVAIGASVGFGQAVASGDSVTTKEQQQYDSLSAQSEASEVRNIGGTKLSTWASWIDTVPLSPVPVGMDLTNIGDLLTAARFPADPDISAKRAAMNDAITNYCLEGRAGLVYTRNAPTSLKDTSVYQLTHLADDSFVGTNSGETVVLTFPTPAGGDRPLGAWAQRVDGKTDQQLRSGDLVYVGHSATPAQRLYFTNDAGSVSSTGHEPDASCVWKILTVHNPAAVGLPIAQGTPILLQSTLDNTIMLAPAGSRVLTGGNPSDAPRIAWFAFV